jgi:nitroimidazol reductase NimA-like FMN-containing flavoprotein (pyridoxamine 5'-phosphate oxidase superfamily)
MSPRADVSMSAEEIDAFLRSQQRAVVVANRADGAPGAAVGTFRGPEMEFGLATGDPVIALLADDERVCCVVDQFPSYYEIKGVMLHGRARVVGNDASITSYKLAVEQVVSFDFAKLRGP